MTHCHFVDLYLHVILSLQYSNRLHHYFFAMVKCTPTKHAQVVLLCSQGVLFDDIGEELHLSGRTACRNYDKYHKNMDYYHKEPWSGRPCILDKKDLQEAEALIENGEARDGADARWKLFPHVGESTIWRNLCKIGLHG